MNRSDIKFGQLQKALQSLGFSSSPSKNDPLGTVFEHSSGAMIVLPEYSENDTIYEHHLLTVRHELDHFGLATPSVFAEELHKVS